MAKKLFMAVTLILVVSMVLSACTKATSTETPMITESSTVEVTATITQTPTSTPIPSMIPEDISNSVAVEPLGTNTIKISNTSKNRILSVYRRLATEVEKVVDLRPQESIVDNVIWDGTQYNYWGEDIWGNKTNEVETITEIAEITKQRGLFYDWDEVAEKNEISSQIKDIDSSSKVYDYFVHGVEVKVVYTKICVDSLTETEMSNFLLTVTEMFHKHWQFYEGFPLDEYRVTCWWNEVESENELGHQIIVDRLKDSFSSGYLINDERLSHEIGHAWIGTLLNFSNQWMWEGIDKYNGIIVLDSHMSFLSNDLQDDRYLKHMNEPLSTMVGKYFKTGNANVYYVKGSFFTYLVSKKLKVDTDLDYSGFMKYLYDTYYLTQNHQDQSIQKYSEPIEYKTGINDFSGLDFSDLFNKYVDGTEDITENLKIEAKNIPVFISASGNPITYNTYEPMTRLFVPEGEFTMGSDVNTDEQPIHKVYLDSFWIDQTEVTNAMYAQCVTEGACTVPHNSSSSTQDDYYYYGYSAFNNYPVIYVDWYQAKTYCEWAGGSLPTEAQWEKAARGTDERNSPWGNENPTCDLANISGCKEDTSTVGSYPAGASPYGALDMAGNVWEWVSDWYGTYPAGTASNPQGPSSGEARVMRGESWFDVTNDFRSALRGGVTPLSNNYDIGFRCVLPPD